jgi:hypothetical protein
MKISKWDDYLIHQVAKPIDTLGTDNPNFMDRIWFMCYSEDGSLQMMAGLGAHPNKKLMDGFLLVRHKGIQRNVRVSRHVHDDRSDAVIGPLSFEVVAPQKEWRIRLADNDYGIGCALDFDARMAPFLYPTLGFTDQEQLHYKQPGHCSGTITFEGKEFAVRAAPAVRDRSWGVRKPGIVSGLDVLVVVEAHFPSSSATLIYLDSVDGFRMRQGALMGDDGSVTAIMEMKQRVAFEGQSQKFSTVDLLLVDAKDQQRRLAGKAISDLCYFSGGGYDGRHGLDRGPYLIEGERWDVSKQDDVASVFPYYSRIAEFELDGERGIGHVEAFFSQEKNWVYKPTLTEA